MSRLTVSLIQTRLHWENAAANRTMLGEKIASIEAPQVVVLPEMFSTGFSMQPEKFAETMGGETLDWMEATARKHRIILTGSLMVEEGGKCYNRLVWMQPDGQYGLYDKRHLFAFGGEHEHYAPGKNRFIASANGWKINLMICYDLRLPVWARQQFGPKNEFEYDALVYVANWPERRSTAWKSLLQARAIENQSYVIGVNRVGDDGRGIYHSGDSMVVDPLGEILYHKADDEDIFTITLDKKVLDSVRDKFPFWRDADRFQILNR